MKRLLFVSLLLLIPQLCFAAISANTVWEIRSSASINMVNGGGFVTGASGTDYSQQDAAQLNPTDLACLNTSTTLTSAIGGFTAAMVGNIIHITVGTNFVVGWYEITAYTDTNTVTIDRTAASVGLNATAGTGYVGGSLNVGGSLEDDFFEQCVAGNIVYFKGAVTYTPSEAVTIAAVGTSALPIWIEGYNTTRGDNPTEANRPTIACGSNSFTLGNYWGVRNLIFTGTGTNVISRSGTTVYVFHENCKVTNSSATADRTAISGAYGWTKNCEVVSTNGKGISNANESSILGCYIHDSVTGISATGAPMIIMFNIIDTCSTVGISDVNGQMIIVNNILYGGETPAGTGINFNGQANGFVVNNIIYGFVTGVSNTSAINSNYLDYNDFYNNTTDVSNVTKGDNDIALNPTFTSAAAGNFTIGTNLKAKGFPGAFPGGLSTGYLDIGAVQREEAGGGGAVTTSYGFTQ